MRRIRIAVLVTALCLAFAGHATAGTFTIQLNTEFSGGAPPAGTAPWLTATFTDIGGGVVRLTMSAANLTGTEFADDWLFNLDPNLDPTKLVFTPVSTSGSVPNSISTGVNAFKADGDGYYDILFDFPPPPGSFAAKFTTGETVIYDITYTGSGTLDANSFNFESVNSSGNGTYLSAAHVQGIGPTGALSGWIGGNGGGGPPQNLPEPTTLLLFVGTGFLSLSVFRRKKS